MLHLPFETYHIYPLKLVLFCPDFYKMQFQGNNCLNKSFRPNHKLEHRFLYKNVHIFVFFSMQYYLSILKEIIKFYVYNSLVKHYFNLVNIMDIYFLFRVYLSLISQNSHILKFSRRLSGVMKHQYFGGLEVCKIKNLLELINSHS